MRGLVLLMLVIAGVGIAVSPRQRASVSTGPELYRHIASATAWVHASGEGKGTGFVIDSERRLLVTCYHVVGENETCEVVFLWKDRGRPVSERRLYLEHMPTLQKRGLTVQGKVLRRSKEKDLALVELPALPPGVTALSLAAESIGPGQRVWSVGNRFDVGTLFTAVTGRVRAIHSLPNGYFSGGRQLARGARLILTDVPINEGDSGGPLVNELGELVGVGAAVAWEAHGGGLFIDLSELRAFLGQNDNPVSPGISAGVGVYPRAICCTALVYYAGGTRSAGVVVDRDRRLILTTADAVAREKTVELSFVSGQRRESSWYLKERQLLRRKGYLSTGTVLVVDPRRNLALIESERLPASVQSIQIAKTPTLPGESFHLITHPARLDVLWVYSAGVVRQVDRFAVGRVEDGPAPAVLIAQSALSDGECGPAFSDGGQLIGFASGKIGAQQQVAYVIESSEIRAFLDENRSRTTPGTSDEHLARAEVFLIAQQLQRAREEYSLALKVDPNNASAFAGRAWIAHLLEQPKDALADADRALALDAKQVMARCTRAAVLLSRGESNRSIEECDRAIKDDPKSARAFALRALAKVESGDNTALADAHESIWLDGKLALAYLARGRVRAAREESTRAAEDFARAIALDQQFAEAYRWRGEMAWRRSDVDSALADFSESLKYRPTDAQPVPVRELQEAHSWTWWFLAGSSIECLPPTPIAG